ncbi:MAG: hypothetical protein JWL59_2709 [Chthoniobacteraceae bacterium]|nr:hypothetical protein [Chthoniobacteraceae bacterium]
MNSPGRNCAVTLAFALLLAPGALAQSDKLNLTPVDSAFELDGVKLKITRFYSEASFVEYSPPWPIAGSPEIARMPVPGMDAQADIQRVQTAVPLDLTNDEAVKKFVTGRLPKEAEDVEVAQVERDALKINNKPTVEVTLDYVIGGRRLELSTLLVQRSPGDTVYLFSLSANPANFQKLRQLFRRSLYSITEF